MAPASKPDAMDIDDNAADKAKDANENKNNGADDKEEFDCAEYDEALAKEESDPARSIALYTQLIARDVDATPLAGGVEMEVKMKEQSIYHLGAVYKAQAQPAELEKLAVTVRPVFARMAKSKTAKIVRTLIDMVAAIDTVDTVDVQTRMCIDAIAWCVAEKRKFLKQRIEAKLASLHLTKQEYKESLRLIKRLAREVKKFDDKLLMVEICLIETQVHHALQNMPKAKGALTAARSAASAIYCPPLLQAQIDLLAGVLGAEEGDYKTSFSYFYEAFEGYNTMNVPQRATLCLKYMMLGKIMTDAPEDVYALVNGKSGLKYAGVEINSMKAVADAYKARSIQAFEDAYSKFHAQLHDDEVILSHVDQLKAKLLEQNLIRLVEPFSRVQIAHIAKLIDLPLPMVESKLSEMILDKKFVGTLDQGSGDLIVFDDATPAATYEAALATVAELGNVVDRLHTRARKINA